MGTPLKLARTVIVGKNVGLVKQMLEFVSYFIRCCDVKENSIRMEKQRDILGNRQSGSNWSDTLSASFGSQNSHIQNWFERSCNIVSAPPNTTYDTSGTVDYFKDFKSYSHLDALKEETEHEPGTEIGKILKCVNSDTTKCYCSLLQALNKISEKKLKSYVRMDDLNTINSSTKLSNGSRKNEIDLAETLKCCVLCRTLEKGMFEEFCDKCRLELEKINLDVSLVCLHCVQRLDRLKNRLLGTGNLDDKNSLYPIRTSRSDSKFEKTVCQSKPSFVCYCCSPCTYGDLRLDLHVDTTLDGSDDLNITPRPRNTSDPVDFIAKAENNFSNLRNSTNSHDSGTEMEYCSSGTGETLSECYTRTNSLSSQSVAQDFDSDYCSVENEQLASTLTDMTPTSNLLAVHPQQSFANCVMKSSSTSTLKAPTIVCNGGDRVVATCHHGNDICDVNECTCAFEDGRMVSSTDEIEQEQVEEQLVNELKSLKLLEINLPRSITRQPRKSSSK